jgi:hypothetical protein
MSSTLDQQAKAALKRLNADWKEIQQSPILGVSAVPLEKDIFEVCFPFFLLSNRYLSIISGTAISNLNQLCIM